MLVFNPQTITKKELLKEYNGLYDSLNFFNYKISKEKRELRIIYFRMEALKALSKIKFIEGNLPKEYCLDCLQQRRKLTSKKDCIFVDKLATK